MPTSGVHAEVVVEQPSRDARLARDRRRGHRGVVVVREESARSRKYLGTTLVMVEPGPAGRLGGHGGNSTEPLSAVGRFGWKDYRRCVREDKAPGAELVRCLPRYLRRRHHPSHEGSLAPALEYLSHSPDAVAARTAQA